MRSVWSAEWNIVTTIHAKCIMPLHKTIFVLFAVNIFKKKSLLDRSATKLLAGEKQFGIVKL